MTGWSLRLDEDVSYTTQVTWWRVVGLLSGTSMDAVDVAVADLRLHDGTIELRPLGAVELGYPEPLRDRLLAALPPGICSAGELCALDTLVGQAFADAAVRAVREIGGGTADLVASLGQTLYHWVDGDSVRGTLQIGQAAWIAEATGLPVVSDLRARDVAAGGHGAPLAPALDLLLLPDQTLPCVALNIGGIANVTVTGEDGPFAYDTGPGNALIDAAATIVDGGRRCDLDGALAAAGTVHSGLLETLLADPYFAKEPPKSTGKEHFNLALLRAALVEHPGLAGEDLLATVTELTARTVADACRTHRARTVLASGGGTRNPTLMARLRFHLAGSGATLSTSDDLGIPSAAKESYLAALLGFLTFHGLPAPTRGTTGAREQRILGTITPGGTPLEVPPPAARPARRMRIVNPGERTPGKQETP